MIKYLCPNCGQESYPDTSNLTEVHLVCEQLKQINKNIKFNKCLLNIVKDEHKSKLLGQIKIMKQSKLYIKIKLNNFYGKVIK